MKIIEISVLYDKIYLVILQNHRPSVKLTLLFMDSMLIHTTGWKCCYENKIYTRTRKKEPFYKNVAAYCRVSTEQDIQYHSLEVQKEYYKKLIDKRIDWRFVDIYADRISGKNSLKLKELQRLMDDCRAGKIDLILVKSISRLGRNTLQFLSLCVELYELNVEVYFEVENLYLSNPVTLQVLTIYASLYQNESQSKSAAVKWSFETAFINGTSGFYNRPCYGYKKDKEGKMVIDPDKAEVVRLIFKMHEEKCSLRNIAAELIKRKS